VSDYIRTIFQHFTNLLFGQNLIEKVFFTQPV